MRHRAVFDLNATDVDPSRICFTRYRHAFLRIIDAENLSRARDRGQLIYCPSTATADVQYDGGLPDRHMPQARVRQFGMMPIHFPQNEPAKPPRRFTALTEHLVCRTHNLRSQSFPPFVDLRGDVSWRGRAGGGSGGERTANVAHGC